MLTKWVQYVRLSIDFRGFGRHFAAMNDTGPSPSRQDGILDAAFQAFAAYGYRRTSMDDIARAAGISRSALYLHFDNKEDIFRSLAGRHFDQMVRDMDAALRKPGQSLEQALFACFVAKDGKLVDAVLATPHGAELLDAGLSAAPDLVKTATARAAEVLGRWLDEIGLIPEFPSAQSLAETIIAALSGLKSAAHSIEDLRSGEAQLARLVARALR